MAYNPNNPNGQATMANSGPVVIASDQSAVPVTGTITTNQGTANSTPWNENIAQYGGTATTLGQKVSASSIPVVIASDDTVAVSAVSLPLPTGAATSALQTTINTTLGSPMQQSGGSIVNISGTISLPTGAATSANQSTEITSLSSIVTNTGNIPAKGAATTANSTPVNIASDQVVNMMLPDLIVTGAAAQTATVNNILTTTSGTAATDLKGYKSALVQVVSTGTGGTFIFEGSNDNVNFQTVTVYNQLVLTGTPIAGAITAAASQIGYLFPIMFEFYRLRIATTITGGSIQAFSRFTQSSETPPTFEAAQATAANLQTTATIASGTVTTVTTLTTLANGQTANGSATTGSPLRIGGKVVTTLPTAYANGNAADIAVTTAEQVINKPFGSAENDWQASSGVTALATTTSTALKAAGAASIRNYATAIQVMNTSATVSTTVSILDGATVIWTGFLPATTTTLPQISLVVEFPTPLRGTAATAMNIQLGTTGAAVYYNVQGYQSF
jgi:hypothetical protein